MKIIRKVNKFVYELFFFFYCFHTHDLQIWFHFDVYCFNAMLHNLNLLHVSFHSQLLASITLFHISEIAK